MNETSLLPLGSEFPKRKERQGKGRQAQADGDVASDSKLERHDDNAAVGKGQAKGRSGQRYLIRITSFRRRLIDEDNLCSKLAIDCCRYAGLIPDDAPGVTKIESAQQKVGEESQERTLIEIFDITK